MWSLPGQAKPFVPEEMSRAFMTICRTSAHISSSSPDLLHGAVSRIARMPKPVIAAVNGVVAGGGMGLMLACDLSYAVETATLTMAYTRIGANPDGSSTFWLPRLVGVRRALELIYTNRVLSAPEAQAWGILNGVMAPERFWMRCMRWRDNWRKARR